MSAFGSLFLWAQLRSVLPQNVILCSLIGISSAVCVIHIGQEYLDFVDYQLGIYGSA
jgi:hypothetical protein